LAYHGWQYSFKAIINDYDFIKLVGPSTAHLPRSRKSDAESILMGNAHLLPSGVDRSSVAVVYPVESDAEEFNPKDCNVTLDEEFDFPFTHLDEIALEHRNSSPPWSREGNRLYFSYTPVEDPK